MIKNYVGIDYGRARIGLAHSWGQRAKPLAAVKNKGHEKSIIAIHDVLRKFVKGQINPQEWCAVIGVPLGTNGEETEMCAEIRRFGGMLGSTLKVEIQYHNERCSSIEAEDYIRERLNISRKEMPKELVDTVAATVILQGYLDS